MNKLSVIAVLSLTALAGCDVTTDQPRTLPVATPQVSAEGDWVDTSGIVSSFHTGTFTTRTTDSNQVLASGTYINTSPTLVEINMTSHVRNTQSKVNCQLVTASQLNCTSQTGAQFSLARRAPNAPPLSPLPSEINKAAATTAPPASPISSTNLPAPGTSPAAPVTPTTTAKSPSTTTPVSAAPTTKAKMPAAATPAATTTPSTTPSATTTPATTPLKKKLPVLKPGASAKM